jgi:hypothetical protein
VLTALVAIAAAPLVTDGAPDASARVAAASGLPAGSFVPIDLASLRAKPPVALGGAVELCAGEPATNAAIAELARQAKGDVLYVDYEAAASKLATARAMVPCLAEPADAAVIARVELLRGVLAVVQGQPADRAFADAKAIDPHASWDADFGDVGQAAFAAASPAMVPLRVEAPGATALRVDGALVGADATVPRGRHVVQTADPAVTVVVDAADSTVLVVPAAYPADALHGLSAADRWPSATRLLAAALGEGELVYVASDGAVLRATTGRSDWERLDHPVIAENPPPTPARHGHPLSIGGTAALGVGVGAGILGEALFLGANDDRCAATSTEAWRAADARMGTASGVRAGGVALGAAGVALAVVGVAGRW